jgi:hypothetical protein
LVGTDNPYSLDFGHLRNWAALIPTKYFFSLEKKTNTTILNWWQGTPSSVSSEKEKTFHGFLTLFPAKVIPPDLYSEISHVLWVVRDHFVREESFPRGWEDVDKLAMNVSKINPELRLPIGTYLANASGLDSSIVCSKAVLDFIRASRQLTGADLHPQLGIANDDPLYSCTRILTRYCDHHCSDVHKAIATLTDSLRWIANSDSTEDNLPYLLASSPTFQVEEFHPMVAFILKATMHTQEWTKTPYWGEDDDVLLAKMLEIKSTFASQS